MSQARTRSCASARPELLAERVQPVTRDSGLEDEQAHHPCAQCQDEQIKWRKARAHHRRRPRGEHRQAHGDQDQSQFGRSGGQIGQSKFTCHARCQERVDRQQQIAAQGEHCDIHPNEGRQAQPKDDDEVGQRIHAVIDEIAVIRPLDLAVACQAAIERIAEPVDEKPCDRQPQPLDPVEAEAVACKDGECSAKSHQRQTIRRDPGGQARAQPVEQPPLSDREHVALDPVDAAHGCRRSAGRRCIGDWGTVI